ncbi:LLM class flavin-dependent oxidoreductase [Nonomuraea thailandensis]
MSRSSVIVPHQPGKIGEVVPYADLVKRGLAARLWLGQSLRLETHAVIAYLAGAGYRIPVGTSVALMALRNPAEAAAQARSLAVLTGHRLVAGFGASYPALVAQLTGAAPRARPRRRASTWPRSARCWTAGTCAASPCRRCVTRRWR